MGELSIPPPLDTLIRDISPLRIKDFFNFTLETSALASGRITTTTTIAAAITAAATATTAATPDGTPIKIKVLPSRETFKKMSLNGLS